MVNLLITSGIISLLAATIGVLIALKLQSRVLRSTGTEREAWQHAQEAHQRIWEVKQRKQAFELEQKLTQQVQQIQESWQRWEAHDEERLARLAIEQKLARIPRVEDVPVPSNEHGQAEQTNSYDPCMQPPSFYKANLSGRDLSQRYLENADLREAQLANTNFYMADLAGACLTGANLTGANLAGANLSGADLRDAVLTGANMLVTDLNGAILNGANLLGAHNLTVEQINSAIYNSNTRIDIEFDITQPRIGSPRLTGLKSSTTPASLEVGTTIPFSRYQGKGRAKAN